MSYIPSYNEGCYTLPTPDLAREEVLACSVVGDSETGDLDVVPKIILTII